MLTFIKRITKRITDDGVTVYAAQASFYIIISGIPFIYLLFIPTARLIVGRYGEVARFVELLLPQTLGRVVDEVFNEINGKTDIRLLGFSVVTLIWTASRSTQAVERGVRRVYRSEIRRSFIANIIHSVLYTGVFVIMIIITLILLVFGGRIIETVSHLLYSEGVIYKRLDFFRVAGAFVILSVIFSFIYRSFSGRKNSIVKHISGGVITGAGWLIFSKLFTVYTMYFSNHSYLYGSFAAIVLFMLWIYSCMIIFLFGAEINVIFDEFNKGKG